MHFNPLDLILGALILLLGLKGALTGFRRELFGFIGLIGGVFIASRTAEPLAGLIETHLFRLANPAALRLIAFVLILTLVWGSIAMLGRFVEARSSDTPPSPLSRFAGFLLAGTKYFLVFAMILAAFYRTPFIHNSLHWYARSSLLFPWLSPAGKMLIHLFPPEKKPARIPGKSPRKS